MPLLVLVRHGQSEANLANVFTGWLDVPLTPQGEEEARAAGRKLHGLRFDAAFCSTLLRSFRTLELILEEIGQPAIPVYATDALRERMYGALQGHNKLEAVHEYGAEQVARWRRGYDDAPPAGESLHHTLDRVVRYYDDTLVPALRAGRNLLVVSHGNTLRALRMQLDGLSVPEVEAMEIPTGAIRVYEFTPELVIQAVHDM
ncbi:2,3-bisphosphoglycerate-dependent phosphoglycerate mutase [Hymenobacter armeniacus]|uniref:2,3-bisphosphoglycerate-dependent phosphoglycerate mutase n=1 Tax=Hymenobacter armeniacus TaxID=2771358 RepID=A0ABR8JM57_9BACT|nr:2,3-diphosphoglycerate-dependent phosphoglycerate mutase [Hymenobacter armeniacus]MBD2721084.1 2,3-diphosphoglycerate-dependent phosphoglycerate mutase [Hymenobacter armeniacus]